MRGHIGIAQDVGLRLQILQTCLTTSPMLMIPAILPSRSTGMCRMRWRVISCITRLTLSSGDTVITPYRMISFTGIEVALSP